MKNIILHTSRHEERRCPKCGKLLDAATSMGEKPNVPTAGDFTVCTGCAALLTFDERLTLRSPSSGELAAVKADPEAWKLLCTTQRFFRDNPWK